MKFNIEVKAFPATEKNRIVFYDFFAMENRGFTQAYLFFLIEKGYEILYVTTTNRNSPGNPIIKLINDYLPGQVFFINDNASYEARVTQFIEIVYDFQPSKIFIHNAPWDIVSCCAGLLLKKSGASTYMINITDHSFWLGVRSFDYYIDFRKYGYLINRDKRRIASRQLFIIPTPPHLDKITPYEPLNIETVGKVIGFSGGNSYKISDKPKTFLNAIKTIIRQNRNFIFLYADVDNSPIIKEFVRLNGLESQFLLIGNRKDINQVFKRIDIYFNTYPYGGGLMLQYALANRKPIVALTNPDLPYTRIDKVIDQEIIEEAIITDTAKFISFSNLLIRDTAYRNKFANEIAMKYDPEVTFGEKLNSLLSDHFSELQLDESLQINQQAISSFHFESDNSSAFEYPYLKDKYFSDGTFLNLLANKVPVLILKSFRKIGIN